MPKSTKEFGNVENNSVKDFGSEVVAAKDEQPAVRKKTLMEIFRSERMKKIVKYLGRF